MDYLPDIGTNPDWGMGTEHELMIDKVDLGDGYVQRRPKGINPIRRTFTPTWTLLSKEQKDTLVDFFRGTYGVTPFLFTDPDHGDPNEAVKVTCGTTISVEHSMYNGYSVSVTLTEDFNP